MRQAKRVTDHLITISLMGASLFVTIALTVADDRTGTAPSQTAIPVPAAASKTAPGDILLDKSRVYIRVGKTGFGHEHGVTGTLKEGTLNLFGAGTADKIVFDMSSFDSDSDASRKYVGLTGKIDASTRKQVNANMLGGGVLDIAHFPTATLEIESVKPKVVADKPEKPLYEIVGKFTLHGTKRPITVLATADNQGELTHVQGSFIILQSDYGITPFSKALGAVGVTDRLQIWGDFWVAN